MLVKNSENSLIEKVRLSVAATFNKNVGLYNFGNSDVFSICKGLTTKISTSCYGYSK